MMKKLQRGFTAIEMFVVVLAVLGLGGWIANIVKLIGMDWSVGVTGWMLARLVGIFVAPLGGVLGFF